MDWFPMAIGRIWEYLTSKFIWRGICCFMDIGSSKSMHNRISFNNDDKARLAWLTGNKFIVKTEKILLQNIKTEGIDNILEVGCGEGANIYNLYSGEKKFVGVDIDCGKLGVAAPLFKKSTFVCADALNLPFRDNSFDLVFCRDVLHHVSDRKIMVDEMLRVCRLKGKIVVIEANGNNLFWNIFGTLLRTERGVKKNTIPEFKRFFLSKYAGGLSEITINLFNTPMFLRLLTHYKYGWENLGNNKCFLYVSNILDRFKSVSFKRYWPYIIVTAIKK